MNEDRKFFRNEITVVILSVDAPLTSELSLADLHDAITSQPRVWGPPPCALHTYEFATSLVTAEAMAELLTEGGTDPAVFGLGEEEEEGS